MTDAMQSQIRDCVGRLTWGHQSVRTCINGGVPIPAIRAALLELGRDPDAEMKMIEIHAWDDCPICERHVRCGYCGNNCCNGGTGNLPDGSKCGCDEAYEKQAREMKPQGRTPHD